MEWGFVEGKLERGITFEMQISKITDKKEKHTLEVYFEVSLEMMVA